ncbi:unnamed protein product [Nezara viridula]|uniref:Uncharacterized protein n=1 Tax=Nezara viridula TaxID=85310 RepID=A0A9P0HMT4_NEZVI|nr:unnamed protein product [Nezara viridula]
MKDSNQRQIDRLEGLPDELEERPATRRRRRTGSDWCLVSWSHPTVTLRHSHYSLGHASAPFIFFFSASSGLPWSDNLW